MSENGHFQLLHLFDKSISLHAVLCQHSRLGQSNLTKFDSGLLRLHEADEAAVDWLTTHGS